MSPAPHFVHLKKLWSKDIHNKTWKARKLVKEIMYALLVLFKKRTMAFSYPS